MEKESKVIPLTFKSSAGETERKTISEILTDAEVATILSACSASGPKTEEELDLVLEECERIRIEGVLLNLLLKAKILIGEITEETFFFQPNPTSEEYKEHKAYFDALKKIDHDGQS